MYQYPPTQPSHESQLARFKPHLRSVADIRNTNRDTFSRFLKNLKHFLIDIWLDIFTIAIIGITAGGVWVSPHTFTRYFPVTFTTSGDIVYPELAYPYVKPIFSAASAGLVCGLVPVAVILLSQIWIRSFHVAANGILGLAYSLVTGTCFQVILKKTIGGLRPHFLTVCEPVIPTNTNGAGFEGVMWTIEQVCTGDAARINNAIESFPSGHSEIAFAGLLYLSIYLFAFLKIRGLSRRRKSHWRMLFVVAPILLATYLASTLVLGYHHHGYDVIFGSLIGIVMALFGYRMVFAGLWDPRFNTVPLVRGDGVDYYGDQNRDGGLPMTRNKKTDLVHENGVGNLDGQDQRRSYGYDNGNERGMATYPNDPTMNEMHTTRGVDQVDGGGNTMNSGIGTGTHRTAQSATTGV